MPGHQRIQIGAAAICHQEGMAPDFLYIFYGGHKSGCPGYQRYAGFCN